jgi:uncharacterized protein
MKMKTIPDKVKKLLAKNKLIILATCSKRGVPNNIVVASCGIHNNDILIADCQMKKTLKNLKETKNVSLCIMDKKNYFQIKGKAQYFIKGDWFSLVKKMLTGTAYSPKGAVVIKIKEIYDLDKCKKIF